MRHVEQASVAKMIMPKIFRGYWQLLADHCPSAFAQQAGKVFRIGFLDPSTAAGSAGLVDVFRQELSKLGWIEGKNVAIEYRFAEGNSERVSELAADLVRLKVDLIMASGAPGVLAAKNATTTIPIVMTNVGDPVGAGLVASLAGPGGNVTGLSSLVARAKYQRARDTQGHRLQARASWIFAAGGGHIANRKSSGLRRSH